MRTKLMNITGCAILTLAFNSCDSGSDSTSPTNQTQPLSPSQNDNPPSQNPNEPVNGTTNQIADTREAQLAALITGSSEQMRSNMRLDPILSQVARAKAEDMAARRYFDHTNPDGFGPNALVTQMGYILPSFYSSANNGNNIESIAAGNATANATLQQWIGSPGHRTQIFGEAAFYREQLITV